MQSYKPFVDRHVGDRLGVVVTSEGDLHLTINGIDQGVAWRNLPTNKALYVVINLNRSPAQISVDHSEFIMSK